jgi:TolB protein
MCVHRVAAMGIVAGAAVLLTGCPKSHPSPAAQGKIAFVSEDRDHNCGIWAMNADGTQPTQLTDDGDYPVWSPDGSRIAFLAGRVNAQYGLYVMSADGSDRKRVCDERAASVPPSWSPDGTQIAFASGRDIWVVDADGGDLLNLTRDAGLDAYPAWSPDGAWIAFQGVRQGNEGIFVVRPDGTGLKRLTHSPRADRFPRWSPDGTKIVFERFPDEDREMRLGRDVWLMNADGSDQRKLVEFAIDPVWSHDGRTIACVHQRGTVEARVYTVSPEGGNAVPRTADGAGSQDSDPSWSPDGRQIAYCAESWPDGWYDIFVVNADGTDRRQLTHMPTMERNPIWQPEAPPGLAPTGSP